jgi:hypothetical protein
MVGSAVSSTSLVVPSWMFASTGPLSEIVTCLSEGGTPSKKKVNILRRLSGLQLKTDVNKKANVIEPPIKNLF